MPKTKWLKGEALKVDPVENWKPVVGREGRYEVSDLGRVRTIARRGVKLKEPYVLKQFRVSTQQAINFDAPRQTVKIDGLVLEAFVGPRPKGLVAKHKDRDQRNVALSNLEWAKAGGGGRKNNCGSSAPVRDRASSRAPCRSCGEYLRFEIQPLTTRLMRLNLDGTPHHCCPTCDSPNADTIKDIQAKGAG